MNKKILTILGCSSSLALTMTGIDSVSAKEYVFMAPDSESQVAEIPQSDTDYPLVDCSCQEYDAETAAKLDREGDKAIELYGCDCAGCRNLVRNPEINNPQS